MGMLNGMNPGNKVICRESGSGLVGGESYEVSERGVGYVRLRGISGQFKPTRFKAKTVNRVSDNAVIGAMASIAKNYLVKTPLLLPVNLFKWAFITPMKRSIMPVTYTLQFATFVAILGAMGYGSMYLYNNRPTVNGVREAVAQMIAPAEKVEETQENKVAAE